VGAQYGTTILVPIIWMWLLVSVKFEYPGFKKIILYLHFMQYTVKYFLNALIIS